MQAVPRNNSFPFAQITGPSSKLFEGNSCLSRSVVANSLETSSFILRTCITPLPGLLNMDPVIFNRKADTKIAVPTKFANEIHSKRFWFLLVSIEIYNKS